MKQRQPALRCALDPHQADICRRSPPMITRKKPFLKSGYSLLLHSAALQLLTMLEEEFNGTFT